MRRRARPFTRMEGRMNTPVTRATVSIVTFAVALTMTVALGACAHAPSPVTRDGPVTDTPEERLAVRFDNDAQTYVDVYLIGDKREWWLGRVAPGAHATLRIPKAATPAMAAAFMKIAVLEGKSLSMDAARDPHATITIAQPAFELLSQRWTFSQRQLALPEILGTPGN